jgi:hypothetical protein
MLLGNDFLGDIEPASERRFELGKGRPVTDGLSENWSTGDADGRYVYCVSPIGLTLISPGRGGLLS